MPGISSTERIADIASTTLNVYASKTLQDQVFNADPLWMVLYKKGRKEQYLRGGEYIQVPLMVAANTTGTSYSGLDPLNISASTTAGNAIYPWRLYNIAITISGEDLAKNTGDAAVIDLLKAKIKQAQQSMEDDLATMLYGDGTGNGGKDMYGLQAIVGTGALAGIDGATYTWWQSKVASDVGELSVAHMRTMVNLVRGSGAKGASGAGASVGKVDVIVTTREIYEAYEALVADKLQVNETALGELGFDALRFKGAELTWSDNCPAGCIYYLSTSSLALKVHPDRDFSATKFQEPIDKDGLVGHIRLMGNLVTDNRRRLGVSTGVTVV